ncbi:ferredoxin-thioredoxin reductase variable chain [[Synechococcus] sp. NIES-970]|uniref:ferredoxin-thioredoxin reductase variable chain n=1 Tax=Picosynechococcus sp. NKBG15041c TaxID=1407650 RepID=UPI0004126033|nr:ferredoxin-thioredoxin reductase variable chain [Picosynechococcus sp. NKBG15041c]BAW97660.1 ferredoxin-thioredoxin reductase variable chain [[Synechococcus] sp. NIES-970]
MNVGDRIRVTASVIVYNHPQSRKQAFDLKGMEGEIEAVIGRPITATLPVKVRFEPKYAAHLREDEIEVI